MELNSLRSHLQHACPDLRNLTNGELEECKWLTKKKVFVNLLASSRLLQDHHEQLVDLNEERNAESSVMKRENTSREIRLESETVYRTKFMRIVLSALTRLKWPPSLEAFADPLDSLFNDAATFRDAAQFFLKVAIPVTSQAMADENDVSHSKLPPRPKSSSRRSQAMDASVDGTNPFDTSLSALSHDLSDMDISALKTKAGVSDSMISSFGYEQTNFTPRTPHHHEDFIHSPRGDPFEVTATQSTERKQALNWKAFELLQRQNEVLSVRLRELQLSVLKRDESETKIAGILSELKNTIAEIVEAGSVDSSKQQSGKKTSILNSEGSILRGNDLAREVSKALSSENGKITAALSKVQEMELFRLEVEREKDEKLSQKDKSLGISQLGSSSVSGKFKTPVTAGASSNSKPPAARSASSSAILCAKCAGPTSTSGSAVGPSSVPSSSGVMWSKLHGRLSALEAQWSSAQRAARSLAEGHDDHYSSATSKHSPKGGSPPPRFGRGGATSSAAPGVLYSAQSTPSRSLVNRAYGVQPALISGADERHYNEIKRSQGGGGSTFGDIYSSPPQPPASRHSQYSSYAADSSDLSSGGLDLQRVHVLQRDLIAFAERAFAWTSQSLFVPAPQEINNDSQSRSTPARRMPHPQSSAQHPDALPLSEQAARRQQEAQELQQASSDLLVHLSGVAPIVPLALDSPLKSSMTGLEALIHETTELAYPKISKQAQLRLQMAADRALAEQVATIRCWRQTRSCLEQWVAHATRVAPTLKMLGRRHKSNVEHAAEDLSALSAGLGLISEALAQAEAVRIRPSATSSSSSSFADEGSVSASMLSAGSGYAQRNGAPISPLDSLARGSAGKEVAALVNALRAQKDGLGEAAQTVRTLGAKLAAELKKDLLVVASTEKNLLFAADLSENVLEAAQPMEFQDGADAVPTANSRKASSSGRTKRTGAESASTTTSTLAARPAFDLSLS